MKIPFIKEKQDSFLDEKSLRIDIDKNNWGIKTNTKVHLFINHNQDCVNLHYFVKSDEIRATYKDYCQPVWQDSCVEFFLTFDDVNYYNFEFNALGTCLAYWGSSRDDRVKNPNFNFIKTISSLSQETVKTDIDIEWNLSVSLDKRVFFKNDFDKKFRANFYSCGDSQKNPYYLSAFEIGTQNPDFHQSKFFKEFILSDG